LNILYNYSNIIK